MTIKIKLFTPYGLNELLLAFSMSMRGSGMVIINEALLPFGVIGFNVMSMRGSGVVIKMKHFDPPVSLGSLILSLLHVNARIRRVN